MSTHDSAGLFRDLFQLPEACSVSQRIAKAALIEHADLAPGDRKTLQNHVQGVTVVAVVDPYTSGIPAFHGRTGSDLERDYAEIHVIDVAFSVGVKQSAVQRFVEVLHRAIPNPTILLACANDDVNLSLAPKHVSAADSSRVVLDRITAVSLAKLPSEPDLFSIGAQHTPHLEGLYRSWESKILAVELAGIWDVDPAQILRAGVDDALPAVLLLQRSIQAQMQILQNQLRKEKQMAERVTLNTSIHVLRAQLQLAKENFALAGR